MAKVASMAWNDALKAALPSAVVHHFHHLDRTAIARIDEQSQRRGESQNVKNLAWLRTPWGRPPRELFDRLVDGHWAGLSPLRVVSGIRDPVDRATSLLFFCADFYGHRTLPVSFRQGATTAFLTEYFVDIWRKGLAGQIPATTFEAILCYAFMDYRDWFAKEMLGCLGIDVTSHPFDFNQFNLSLSSDNVCFFAYRFEDLKEDNDRWPKVASAASRFAGAPIVTLPKINATKDRRAAELYQRFREQLIVPDDVLEEIYSAPILNHFYTSDELAKFRLRWSERSLG